MSDEPTMKPEEKFWYSVKLAAFIVFVIGFALVVFYVLSSFLHGVGGVAGDFFGHIRGLFRDAPNFLKSERGFAAFVQLVLIAVFFGWAIKRIMNYMKRK